MNRMKNWLSNLGSSEWWLGKNSFFAQLMETVGDSGASISLFGTGIGSTGGSQNPTDFDFEKWVLKYGVIIGLGFLIYTMVKKPTYNRYIGRTKK